MYKLYVQRVILLYWLKVSKQKSLEHQ